MPKQRLGMYIPVTLANKMKAHGGISKVANDLVFTYMKSRPENHEDRFLLVKKYLSIFDYQVSNYVIYIEPRLDNVPHALFKQALLVAVYYDEKAFEAVEKYLERAKNAFERKPTPQPEVNIYVE